MLGRFGVRNVCQANPRFAENVNRAVQTVQMESCPTVPASFQIGKVCLSGTTCQSRNLRSVMQSCVKKTSRGHRTRCAVKDLGSHSRSGPDCVRRSQMKYAWISAALVCFASINSANAGLFHHHKSCGCAPAPTCAAPAPTCAAPAACAPTCAAPAACAPACAPSCAAPVAAPTCCAPAPSCCNTGCCKKSHCFKLPKLCMPKIRCCKVRSCCKPACGTSCAPTCAAPAACAPTCAAPAACAPTCAAPAACCR